MTAAERTSSGAGDERVEAVAEVLRAHAWNGRDWGCECGTVLYQVEHHAHVAAALAPLLAAHPDDGAAERLAAAVIEALDPWELECARLGLTCREVNPSDRWCRACRLNAALGQGDGGKDAQAGVEAPVSDDEAESDREDHA